MMKRSRTTRLTNSPDRSAPHEIRRPVAAFFDLDGTLLPPPSLEWRFVHFLMSRGKLRTPNILRWFFRTLVSSASGRDSRSLITANKSYLAGLPTSLATDWARSSEFYGPNASFPGIFTGGLHRIRWHQSRDHRIFLVSGTLAPLAACVARSLPGNIKFIATQLQISVCENSNSNVTWTGELAGAHLVGPAKSCALQAIARSNGWDLGRCYAYGNSQSDRAMLETVGNPVAVNPSHSLTSIARKRAWPSIRWQTAEPLRGVVDEVFCVPPEKDTPGKEANAN